MKSALPIPWPPADRRKRWLIGVSGGLDSMALLHLLKEAGFRDVIVCHLNHGLRGRSSADDARFVKATAKQLGYIFETSKIDLRKLIRSSGESLETTGRNARHRFFASCARIHRCKRLFLAHNMDEQAETALWNLVRGSLGLRGMRAVSEIGMDGVKIEVHRPLLGIRKAELRSWMESRQCRWREDASNQAHDVARNRIRHEAIPLLSEIAKRDVCPPIARGVRANQAMREAMDWALARANVHDPQGRLHLSALRELPEALRLHAIANFLKNANVPDISAALLERCAEIIDPDAHASVNLPGGGRLRRRAGRIFAEGA